METILRIAAALSFVAFIVAMLNPKVVKCSSCGKITFSIIYLCISR